MPTIIDFLLRRDTAQKAVITGTGGTGPGVLAWANGTSIASTSRNPRRLMKQAQELYHRDLIIRAAEHRVSSAMAGLQWHLTDENDDEVTDKSDPATRAIRDWLEKPQGQLTERRQMTRRALWQLTVRHAGLCGTAFWYQDQRNLQTNVPLMSLYVNPARMYPVQNTQGILLGWKLDSDEEGNGGIPLELDEVLQFDFEPPDWGHYGIGLVESAWSANSISTSIERHEAGIFSAGARLAGLISPKEAGTVTDDQWDQAVRSWRNITSDPESAKRLHILRAPVDYQRTAATMQELAVDSIARMAREDKLALWGVPQSQLPLPAPAGLNSGETKGFDEAVLYQGAVHDRVLLFSEVIQFQVLDRIALAGGPTLQLVIDEPAFDNEMPLYERAQKARDIPLTSNERRAQINLPPLPDVDLAGEPLGTAIWLPVGLSVVGAGPDEKGNLIALPEPPPPPPPVEVVPPPEPPAKARTLLGLRKVVDTKFTASARKDIAAALRAQAKAVANRIRARGPEIAKDPAKTAIWWDVKAEDKRLRTAIERHNLGIAELVTGQVGKLLPHKAEPFTDTVMQFVRERTGERIVGINETTRDRIGALIAEGFTQGMGPVQVADTIEAATAFDEARAEMVARTESMFAYNEASLRSFEEFGVTHVEAIDGDDDEECASRNGQEFTVEEALAETDHPNGTLDWAPVIKAVVPVLEVNPMVDVWKAMVDIASRPDPGPPIVNNYITPPAITVETPGVTVLPAEVTVNLPAPTPTTRRVNRNAKGEITSIDEGPA